MPFLWNSQYASDGRATAPASGDPIAGARNAWAANRQALTSRANTAAQRQSQRQPQLQNQPQQRQNPFGQRQPQQPQRQPPQQPQQQSQPPQQPQQRKGGLPSLVPGGLENPFNQKLPDGVTLQPLNADNLRQLAGGGGSALPAGLPAPGQPTGQPPPMPGQPAPGQPAPGQPNGQPPGPPGPGEPDLRANFHDFIQGENNAARFYARLAETSPGNFSGLLYGLSARAARRRDAFVTIGQSAGAPPFTPPEAAFPEGVGFFDGVRMAVLEETDLLRDLVRVMDAGGEENARALNAQALSKLADISALNYILAHK